MYDNASRVMEIDINEILPNRFQPRIQFDEDEILDLSDSIKEHGIIQPLVVRPIGDKYEIIAGERRYKASVLAGKETVPVIIKKLNDKESAEIALIENIQRKNLTPIEEALSYKKILDMGYLTQIKLAERLGKSQSAIANKIRLLNLSDEVQEALLENKISERHARSLLKLETYKLQNELLNRIITERLTVRKTDEEIEKMNSNLIKKENIEEEGKEKMNNNIPETQNFNMFETPAQPSIEVTQEPQIPSFDIFETSSLSTEPVAPVAPVIPSMPTEPVAPVAPVMPSMPTEPVAPVAPAMPSMPTEPVAPVAPVIPSMPTEPVAPVAPVMPSMPTEPVAPVAPVISTESNYQFDDNGNVISVSSEPTTLGEIPQTTPIMEAQEIGNNLGMIQQSEDLFSFGEGSPTSVESSTPIEEVASIPEIKLPEPIIVTDYSKQYDPVMPQTIDTSTPTVEFKEVINIIRECSSKIEQYGFKLDVEEYDLENLYQVIFKVEK